MLFEKIINIFDLYHQKRIINYLRKLNLKYFIDVGAHKGEFLSYILSLNYKKIYCFEPQKKILKILFKNFKNKKNVKIFNFGLAHKNSKIILYENKLTSTSTFSRSKNTTFSKIKNLILNSKKTYIDKYPIKVRTLDEIFINKKIFNIFLKIDVEGFELNVLKGAKKTLSKKEKFVVIERHFFQLYKDNSTEKVHLFLKKNNFKLIKRFTFPLLHFQDNLYEKK